MNEFQKRRVEWHKLKKIRENMENIKSNSIDKEYMLLCSIF